MNVIYDSFNKLRSYCEAENFKGWDPYDGLNSVLFQKIPFLRKSAFCRLVMIQGFKKSLINLRNLFFVPKEYNAKGIALLLQGYCNLYKVLKNKPNLESEFGKLSSVILKINELSELLISLQSKGYSGACWGYTFDWQSKAFFLPQYTPTVVVTSFAVEALLNAYDIVKNEMYLNTALSSANFIIKDLNRIQKPNGFMFSYSPLDNRAVYNATLLGTKTLSLIYKYTGNKEYLNIAKLSALAVCEEQDISGFFPHSDQVGNKWRDNFHTGFKLESLSIYQMCSNDFTFNENIEKGYQYWICNFFEKETGIAKYYDTSIYPIDLHCVAQALPTLYKLGKLNEEKELAKMILNWSIEHMQNKKYGFFYFQKTNTYMNKIAYMRWPNAWMFYGISYWLLYKSENDKAD